jgi:hypothetical protein
MLRPACEAGAFSFFQEYAMSYPPQDLRSYIDIMSALSACVSDLTRAENQMTDSASRNMPQELDEMVRAIQPDLLRFRGLEQKREKIERQLGISGLTIREILNTLSDDERLRAEPVLTELSAQLRLFAEARDNADRIMRVRLMEVQSVLKDAPEPDLFHSTLA